MKDKKQLSLDDLQCVTGGVGQTNCTYFVQALRKPYINKCDNCRYYNEKTPGKYECTNTIKIQSDKNVM